MHVNDQVALTRASQGPTENPAGEGVVSAYTQVGSSTAGTTSGEVTVLEGDTHCAGSFPDSGDTFTSPVGNMLTTMIGDMFGPTGGERAVLIRTRSGFGVLFEHSDDDSPMPPSGERWILHRNPTTKQWDTGVKFTNDGATPGDGLGGLILGNLGGYTELVDSSGNKVALNAVAGTITIQTATGHSIVLSDDPAITITTVGGLQAQLNDLTEQITHVAGQTKTIVDGAGNTISSVVPTGGAVALGALASGMASANAVINNSHLTTFQSSLLTKRLDDLTKFAAAMVSAGVPNAGAVIGLLASLVPVPVPAGSAKVFATS